MRHAVTVLFLLLTFLLDLAETVSAYVPTEAENRARLFEAPLPPCIYEFSYQSVGEFWEDRTWLYNPSTGVPYYVRQNPWSHFDPLGLYQGIPAGLASVNTTDSDYLRSANYTPTEQDAQMMSLSVDFVPYVGTVKGISELATGKDYLTGKTLSKGEKIIAGVGTAFSLIPGEKAAVNGIGKAILKNGSDAVETAVSSGNSAKITTGTARENADIAANAPKVTGRGKNKLKPDPGATGDHTVFQRGDDGKVFKHETYEQTKTGHMNPTKRYDGGKPDGSPGAPHRNKKTGERVPTPHVQGKDIPGGVRPANPDEIPK